MTFSSYGSMVCATTSLLSGAERTRRAARAFRIFSFAFIYRHTQRIYGVYGTNIYFLKDRPPMLDTLEVIIDHTPLHLQAGAPKRLVGLN